MKDREVAPFQRCLNGKKRKCSLPLLLDETPSSPPERWSWNGHRRLELLNTHYAGKFPRIAVSHRLGYLCKCGALWQAFFIKLMSLLGACFTDSESTQALCVAGTNSEGIPKISISILFSLCRSFASLVRLHTYKAGGYVSRLIYLFYFNLGKLSQFG